MSLILFIVKNYIISINSFAAWLRSENAFPGSIIFSRVLDFGNIHINGDLRCYYLQQKTGKLLKAFRSDK